MKMLLTITALFALAVPAAFGAPSYGQGEPENATARLTQSSTPSPAQLCKEQARTMGAANFRSTYAPAGNGRNAMGKCVSAKAQQQVEAQQQETLNAARACKAERLAMGETAFANEYGANPNKRNAFGKCVSQKAKQTS